jgi:hypothetical protein
MPLGPKPSLPKAKRPARRAALRDCGGVLKERAAVYANAPAAVAVLSALALFPRTPSRPKRGGVALAGNVDSDCFHCIGYRPEPRRARHHVTKAVSDNEPFVDPLPPVVKAMRAIGSREVPLRDDSELAGGVHCCTPAIAR